MPKTLVSSDWVSGSLIFSNDGTYGGSIGFGSSASPMTVYSTTPVFSIYTTSADTSGSSVEPMYFKSTMTGIGGTGGRARFHMYTNVALGGWSNALKGYAEYGASGRTTGLGSAICAELVLSAGTTSGTYAALEAELVAGTGAKTGTKTAFIYCNGSGADVATTIDTTANLCEFGDGLTVGSGKFIDTSITSLTAYGGVRVYIPGVGVRWLALVSA